jgi:hypothetical protein
MIMRTNSGTTLWLVFAVSATELAVAGLLTGAGTAWSLPLWAVLAGSGMLVTTIAAAAAALAGWPDATGTAVDPRAPAARANDVGPETRDGGGSP